MPRQPQEPKTGAKSWQPATRLATFNKLDGFRYRWCDKNPDNIERKQLEGWKFVNGTEHKMVDADVKSESDLSGAKQHRELVLMALPEDEAAGRDVYYEQKTEQQTRGLKTDLSKEMKERTGADIHGKITIE